ncbi:MAG: tRNA pseudouridine(13) synthase TruD, partial [Armatimonadetes bacterium]|nr:tRNA pseudouridine(13) synthase TruD [Armatimonadota bacterium]
MKVKATPTDFIVQEESELDLSRRRSEYAVFHLSKTSWDTFDLIDLLARRLGVSSADIGIGGIK